MPQSLADGWRSSDAFEPIAIIGMGCRWPGDCETPQEYWNFLEAKRHAYSEFPGERINKNSFYHGTVNRPGSFYTKGGAFLKADVRNFDHTFFGINPKEVLSLDPAQRKLLEVVYEAFESSGTTLQSLAGSKTGCFVGNFNYDHQLMQYRHAEYPEPYATTGGGITILSNRVSYVFDLKGPSLSLDTACSSSMYALHLACSSIQDGECNAAVVAGSNLILTPECQLFSSTLGAVSPTSISHSFDESADGYARADGVAALYIKKLSDAIADRDPIRAIIRSTAINSNGRTGGITHPSPDGQEAVIRRAYERAGNLDPAETGYFEAHATGTRVGDPLQVAAIARVFANLTTPDNPLLLSAVKSNIGHSEPSSAIAGIMKSALILEKGNVLPVFGLQQLNKNIDLQNGRLKIVTENTPWPRSRPIKRASINSFGYGGANAHCIIEAADSYVPGYRELTQAEASSTAKAVTAVNLFEINGEEDNNHEAQLSQYQPSSTFKRSRMKFLLPYAAHDEATLRKNVEALYASSDSWSARDVAYTLGCRRSLFNNRAFSVVSHPLDFSKEDMTLVRSGKRRGQTDAKLAFIFTGQGAQWPQMGCSLMKEYPVYAKCIRELDNHLKSLNPTPSWNIEETLAEAAASSSVYIAAISQPLVTAVQIALVDLLKSWKIHPTAVVGHSSGEIAASYASGRQSKRDAIIAAYLRGLAIAQNTQEGAMLGVGCTEDIATTALSQISSVRIACFNSPESFTLSGDKASVLALRESLDSKGVFARIVATGGNAYHSHHMLAVGEAYETLMIANGLGQANHITGSNNKNATVLPEFFSSVYARRLSEEEGREPAYWRANLESPVLFHQAVEAMIETTKPTQIIEIGPHTALQGPLRQIEKSWNSSSTRFPEYLGSIRRASNNVDDILDLAGELFIRGVPIDILAVNDCGTESANPGRTIVDLPRYQWQYVSEPLIFENRYTREWRLRTHPRHDILGSRIPGAVKDEPTWRNVLRLQDLPWLRDHCLGQQIVFPSTGYLSLVLEAATQCIETSGHSLSDVKNFEISNMSLSNALVVPDDERGVETLVTLRPKSLNRSTRYSTRYDFTLTSVLRNDGNDVFTEHSIGVVDVNLESSVSAFAIPLPEQTDTKALSTLSWYESFQNVGLHYGPIFQGMADALWSSNARVAQADINLRPTKELSDTESRYIIHPAALDAAMQLSIVSAYEGASTKLKTAFMPVAFHSIKFFPNAVHIHKICKSTAQATLKGVRGLECNLLLQNSNGDSIVEAEKLLLLRADQQSAKLSRTNGSFTRMIWRPDFASLNASNIQKLYEIVDLGDDGIISQLNDLAMHQLIHFRETHQDIFLKGSKEPHLQHLLDWIDRKIQPELSRTNSAAARIQNYSSEHRAEKIARMSNHLKSCSSEARLMCHLYENLSSIYEGVQTGIQVALQNNLLNDLYELGQIFDQGNQRLASVVSLFAHSRPDLSIFEVGAGTGSATREVLPALQGDSIWRRYRSYTYTDTTTSFLAKAEETFMKYKAVNYASFDMEKPCNEQGYEASHDLVIASNVIHATSDIKKTLTNIRGLLRPGGKLILLEHCSSQLSAGLILGTFSDFWKGGDDPHFPRHDGPFLTKDMWRKALPQSGFSGLDFDLDDYSGQNCSTTVLCATAIELIIPNGFHSESSGLSIIYHGILTPFLQGLSESYRSKNVDVDFVPYHNLASLRYRRVIFALELEKPFFLDMTDHEFMNLKSIIESASSILWLTAGNLIRGGDPQFAMISGIAKGLRTENSQIRFRTLDLEDGVSEANPEIYISIIGYESKPAAQSADIIADDVRIKDGIVYSSALIPDVSLNQTSRSRADSEQSTEDTKLADLENARLRLDIEKPSVLSTIFFRDDEEMMKGLTEDEVEIAVKYAGVNNKDLAVISGRHHSDSFSDECSGVISRVGASVTDLEVGDKVYCQSFAKFGTYVRAKAIFCQKMDDNITFAEAVTLPIAFSTAVYALMYLGRLQKGESVLIQTATGAVGIAALQLASYIGAEIYATVGSDDKKQALLRMGYPIKPENVFSRSKSTPDQILKATGGAGIDVIMCSAGGHLLHETWRCIAMCGRFIEIGRTEVLDKGSIALDSFSRNATFSSFDLEILSQSHPQMIGRLMKTIADLRAEGVIKPIPYTTYHISEIDRAFATFAKAIHIGKLVVSYDSDDNETIKYRRAPYETSFDPNAAYLLVGCLGGLGRSFSSWAVQRGARHLIYLTRSGGASVAAQRFLENLRQNGVEATLVKGDVVCLDDVKAAVRSTTRHIKGVVHGALTLNDAFFSQMTTSQFHATLKPRVLGALNLEQALQDEPLDFFQLWSSYTVMFGTASQTNYLASNSFFDAFARRRHAQGLPATSLALSQILDVGIVSERPDYQQNMFRYGFYGNDEDEFLSFCDVACAPAPPKWEGGTSYDLVHDPNLRGHLLAGVEPAGLARKDHKYPVADMSWSSDSRFQNLIQATRNALVESTEGLSRNEGSSADTDAHLSTEEKIRLRVAKLLYVAVDDVDLDTPVNTYGIDSMIAAEIRNWFFANFQKDVPLLVLLANTTTVQSLAAFVSSEEGVKA